MRILVMTDSMFNPSGQGRVGREIALGLGKRGHEVGYIGWFHRPDIFPSAPYNIQFWGTNNMLYGADVLDAIVYRFRPDMLITVGDFWWLEYIMDPARCHSRRLFQWCSYIPVDGEPLQGGLSPAVIPVVEDLDLPVAYTEYAKRAVLKSCMNSETRRRLRVIYHGVNADLFKPSRQMYRNLRQQYQMEDKFIFLTVCRNQQRKNIPNLLQAWKKFSELPETRGRVVLWLHTYFKDQMGWNIYELLQSLELRNGSIMYYDSMANAPSELHLLSEMQLAQLYQLSDAFVLLSGEGFGLPTFEAMATQLPCILLNHSASSELGAEGRAELVDCARETWTGPHLTERPLPNMNHTVEALLKIFKNSDYRNQMARKGYEFAQQYTWDRVLDQWNDMILDHEIPFRNPIELEVVT